MKKINCCLNFGGSVYILQMHIHHSDYSVCTDVPFFLWLRCCLLILISCSFHAGPAFIKIVCVWKCNVERACRDCVLLCSSSLTDGFPESVSIFITFTHKPQTQLHFRNKCKKYFCLSKISLTFNSYSFLKQVYVLLLPYLGLFLCNPYHVCYQGS